MMDRDKRRDTIKFLTGNGVGPSLSEEDQKRLKKLLRGPFENGMSLAEALRYVKQEERNDV